MQKRILIFNQHCWHNAPLKNSCNSFSAIFIILGLIAAFSPVESEPIIVEANRARDSQGQTGSSTSIAIEEQNSRNLPDLLEREASVRIRRFGGEGYLSTISIRGSNPNQVNVSLDGIPLSNAVQGEVNLEDYDLDGLERVDIYRSGDMPGSAIGGAINLVPRKSRQGQGFQTRLKGGSYKTFAAGANAEGGQKLRYNVNLKGATSDQDFKFRSDNGTPVLNEWDDFDDIRKNAHYHNYFSTLYLSHAKDRNSYFFMNDSTWRKHGIPGPVPGQSKKIQRTIGRNTTGLGADWKGLGMDSFRLQSRAYYTHLGTHLRDPLQEFSSGKPNSVSRLQQYGFQLSPELLLPYQKLRLHSHGNYEIFNEEKRDRFDDFALKVPRKFREQYTFRLEDEFSFFDDRLLFLPAVEHQRTTDTFRQENRSEDLRLAAGRIQNYAELEKSRLLRKLTGQKVRKSEENIFPPTSTITEFTNQRLTARVSPYKSRTLEIYLRGGAYTGSRLPLFIELFGERGSIIGNPDLEPEKSETAEAGAGMKIAHKNIKGSLEATGFKRIIEDMILFVPNSQFTLRPENVDRAVIRGAEFSARLDLFQHWKLSSSYTYQIALNDSNITYLRGKYLPLRPMHESNSGIYYYNDFFESGFDVIYVGAVFRDRTNEYPGYVAPRWLYNWQITYNYATSDEEKISFSFMVKNIQNQRTQDTVGYPLPGRNAYASVSYRFHTLEKENKLQKSSPEKSQEGKSP